MGRTDATAADFDGPVLRCRYVEGRGWVQRRPGTYILSAARKGCREPCTTSRST